ncbi:hypothetical protein SARC_15670, partial [Sphaeroforma arctica JP610]
MLGQIIEQLDRRLRRAVLIIPIWQKAIWWPHIIRHGKDLTILEPGAVHYPVSVANELK